MPRPVAVPTALLAAALSTLAPSVVAAQERITLAGPAVTVYNLAGAVTVERGGGSAVVVEVTRGGRDAARLRLEQGPVGERATLRVVYPGSSIRYPRGDGNTNLRVRDDGTFGDSWRGNQGRAIRVGDEGEVEAWADLRILVPPGLAVEVRVAVGEVAARGVQADLQLDTHSGNVTAADLQGRITLDTGSGDVEATGVSGDLAVDTGSGEVLVRGGRVARLGVDTGSGSVRLEGIAADSLTVDTGSGGVSGSADAEVVAVDTGSGDVQLDLGARLRDVEVDTGSGSVTLLVPAAYGARVVLESSSGDLELGLPLQLVRRGDDTLEGTIGDGRGRLTVDTGSGRITVRPR